MQDGTDDMWRQYAETVSQAQGYALDEAQLARVTAQLRLVASVAEPLLAISLPDALEPAPVFKP